MNSLPVQESALDDLLKILCQGKNEIKNRDRETTNQYGCPTGQGKSCLKAGYIVDSSSKISPKTKSDLNYLDETTQKLVKATETKNNAIKTGKKITGFDSIVKLVVMIMIIAWCISLWFNPKFSQFRSFIEGNDMYSFIALILIGISFFIMFKKFFCYSNSILRCNCDDDERAKVEPV